MFEQIVNFIVQKIWAFGYLGIIILMFLESSFFPFPSEVVMIPAGYLAYKGKMNLYISIFLGTLGSYLGAVFNYLISYHFGRRFLLKYGKYFFIDKKLLDRLDNFFDKHGHISTFNGRLIIGIRQYISIPAGLSKMHFGRFSLYTILGAFIWVSALTLLGYYIGYNENLIKRYYKELTAVAVFLVIIISIIYFYFHNKNNKNIRIKRRKIFREN